MSSQYQKLKVMTRNRYIESIIINETKIFHFFLDCLKRKNYR